LFFAGDGLEAARVGEIRVTCTPVCLSDNPIAGLFILFLTKRDVSGQFFDQAALYAFFMNILIRSAKRSDATASG
jgi:hypothetical protein